MKSKSVLVHRLRFAAAVAVAGCMVFAAACDNKPATQTATPPPVENGIVAATPAPATNKTTPPKVVIYRVGTAADGQANLEPVEIDGDPKDSETAVKAINEMAALKETPLPEGAKALSVKFEDTLATVDFNKAFSENFPGGDRKEALVFNAVTTTLGQFPNVKKVQITVEGAKVPLGGTQDTTEPLNVPTPTTVAKGS